VLDVSFNQYQVFTILATQVIERMGYAWSANPNAPTKSQIRSKLNIEWSSCSTLHKEEVRGRKWIFMNGGGDSFYL
jgi:hypothetical protein